MTNSRYGINSFVYSARVPFHPARLYELVHDKFVILEPQSGEEDEEDNNRSNNAVETVGDETADEGNIPDPDVNDGEDSSCAGSISDSEEAANSSPASSISEDSTQFPDIPLTQRLANKKAHPLFKSLLRSKGFVWLATRPKQSGDWSQAGAMLTFSPGMQWFCTLPQEEWPLPAGEAGDEVKKLIEKDYVGEWEDRRQEIVLIGEGLDVAGLTKCLNECLLKGDEVVEWAKVMRADVDDEKREELLGELFEDGWEEWDELDVVEGDDHVHGPACSL